MQIIFFQPFLRCGCFCSSSRWTSTIYFFTNAEWLLMFANAWRQISGHVKGVICSKEEGVHNEQRWTKELIPPVCNLFCGLGTLDFVSLTGYRITGFFLWEVYFVNRTSVAFREFYVYNLLVLCGHTHREHTHAQWHIHISPYIRS